MNNIKKSLGWAVAFLSLASLMGLGSVVQAATPDGETPANEGVCDILHGGTPGLYGLCVAYCEAQDLDLVENSNPPSTKILANYNKKKQAGDPDMPCVQKPCPCWTSAQLGNIGISGDTPVCSDSASSTSIRVLTSATDQLALVNIGRSTCAFKDNLAVPDRISLTLSITADDVATCRSQIITACQ